MNAKKTLTLSLSATIVIMVVGMVLVGQRKAETIITKEPVGQPALAPAETMLAPALATSPEISVMNTQAPVQTAPENVSPVPKRQNVASRVALSGGGKEPIQDPDARVALSLVGADPVAEQYWLAAIYDTSLSDHERENLMEDLNEEGLSNPKHPTPEDLVLIRNRLPAIENAWGGADPFMQRHLWEAYKDLVKLLASQPVQ
jgi:hypothetical protein